MATISADNFITDTLKEIDSVIGYFVKMTYQNFIQENTMLITLIFTLYVMFIGYRIMMGKNNADLNSIVSHMIILLIVYGLIMQWNLYQLFIYDIFTNEPEHIARVLVESTGQGVTSQEVGEALNTIYHRGMQSAKFLFNAHGIRMALFGIIVACFTFIACLQALVFLIYAKMGMAVLLALGPIFILFVLWDSTKGWFSSWINSLFVLALIPILTVTILSLMLSIINTVSNDLIEQAKLGKAEFITVILFGGLAMVNFSLLRQVLPLASSLGGGFSFQAFKLGMPSVYKMVKTADKVNKMFGRDKDKGKNNHSSSSKDRQDKNVQRASTAAKNSKA